MRFLRNKNVTITLIIALVIAILLIGYLCFKKTSVSTYEEQPEETDTRPTLVLFHSHGCGHCKTMMPEWIKAKAELEKYGVKVIDIQGADNEYLSMFDIKGFPTVMLFPEGFPHSQPVVYSGDRTAKSFLEFVFGPPPSEAEKTQAPIMDEPQPMEQQHSQNAKSGYVRLSDYNGSLK